MSDQSIEDWEQAGGGRRSGFRSISPVKLVIAIGCLAAAVYMLGPPLLFIESSQAVTNAPIEVIRSPIAGVVTALLAKQGQQLDQAEPVADVVNDYWDPSALLEAENRSIEARRRHDEAHQEAAALREQQASLRKVQDLWRNGMDILLRSQRDGAVAGLASARARLTTATTTLGRYGDLAKVGAVNLQRLDDVKLSFITAGHDFEGARFELQKIEAQQLAMAGDIMLTGNDRPSTLQQLDSIAIRLATLDATEAAAEHEVASLSEQQVVRERQRDRETRIELRASAGGTVWRFFNRAGDRISANSAVANLIDCDRTGVTAIFSQRYLDALRRGRRVNVRVAGLGQLLAGSIVDANGYYDNDTRSAEAVTIRALDKASVLVHVQLDSAVPGCMVGLHATVRLD